MHDGLLTPLARMRESNGDNTSVRYEKRWGSGPLASPAATLERAFRPVSGLASGVSPCLSPSRAHAQWLRDRLVLAYRCGGSAGIVVRRTGFPSVIREDDASRRWSM